MTHPSTPPKRRSPGFDRGIAVAANKMQHLGATHRPREAPPRSLHLNYRNDCVIVSRALISSLQGGYMVHAARASAPRVAAPPSPNQSLAKHNRKPVQLAENKHQRSKSIASFCRNLSVRPPRPANHHSRVALCRFAGHQSLLTDRAFLIASRQIIRNRANSLITNEKTFSNR